ncbi:dihydrodipicolinate synthase family protein [Streptomyces pseudoechinosporeus]
MHTAYLAQLNALKGVLAVPVTPFTAEGEVDEMAYRVLLRRLLDGGVRTVTACGNTGEFHSLAPAERRRLVEVTVEECAAFDGPAQVIAGIGLDLTTAVDAARHAAGAGAHFVMVHQPVHLFSSPEGWLEYHRTIADAMPSLGVVPYVRDPLLDGQLIGRLGELCPNVCGVKYAVPDAARFAAVARDAGLERFVWVAGLAELYAPAYWAMGATGFTSGLVTVAPRLSLEMLGALRAGDAPAAMKVWERIRGFEALRAANGSAYNVSVVKEALALLGLCRRDVRPPATPLDEARRERVRDALVQWGLL